MVRCNPWANILCYCIDTTCPPIRAFTLVKSKRTNHIQEKTMYSVLLLINIYFFIHITIKLIQHYQCVGVLSKCFIHAIAYEVRSYLQISRSIGDVYLKRPEYNREPLHSKFRLRETFQRPILSSEPQITEHRIQPNDQFVIFASDGLWEHLSNQEAVDLVQNSPRNVCFLLLCYKCNRF